MVDYADIICQAVDEIVTKRLESINYDNTITCSIVDIKDAKAGAYIVTDGSTNFTAYSLSTEYKVNDVVYITVPNNDFTKQKIIIGKQVTKDTTPFIFTTPFDTIVDVSTNLINDDRGVRSLIANNPDIPPEDADQNSDEYYLHQNIKKLVWEKDFENSMLVGFTRLGIQGQFRSWLKSFSAKSGDYGYRLILTCEKDNHETTIATAKRVLKKLSSNLNEIIWGEIQTSDEIIWPQDMILSWSQYNILSVEDKEKTVNKMIDYLVNILKNSYAKYELYLSATDMYGDPYNFQSYYQQEKVYDISNLGKIINMKLEFYQTPESFISNKVSNQLIYNKLNPDMDGASWAEIQELYSWPKKYQFTREQFEAMTQVDVNKLIFNMKNYLCLVPHKHPLFETLLEPNLFDKDPYICVGYDLESFSEEQLVMYSLSSSTYRAGLSNEENTKQAQLRWIHKFEDGTIKAVSNETDLNFEVRWYQYELGHPTIDGYAGVNWKRVNNENIFSYSFLPNIEEAEEKVKAIIIYNDKPIYSNILTFENERQVNNPATLDQLNGLNLWCADNSYGNYRIYNLGGDLEDSDARNHIRDLECHFNSKETEASGLLTDATWIMWRIPASNTMLKIASSEYPSNYTSSNVEEMPKFISIEDIDWKTKVPFSIAGTKYFDGIWSDYMYDASTDEIVSIWKGNSANGFFINPLLEYKIESFYTPSNSNNTITCIIYKNGVQYETQKEFTFGPVGNSGTDWSFEIDFDNNETALTSGNEKSISLTARLYDRNNKDVTYDMLFDTDLNAKLTWSWYKDTINPSNLILIPGSKKNKCDISTPNNNTTINMNSLLYVQCKLEGIGNTSLIAILPIPIRKWINDQKHYSHVTGTDFVVYPSSGYPHYYNNPFKTHIITKTDNTSIVQSVEKGGQWKLFNPHNEFGVYIGNITDKNVLQPAAIYTANVKQYGVQYLYNGQVCWTQPIFTMQNNYPSRALNEWDGKEIKIDYDNGTIIAPAIAAGKKNADNTFSGVMLGDWSANDVEGELKQQTGIYGFEHGAMSYAFKEDGSAFIGKSGFARIKFDGNESTIASESYTSGSYGMMIDLDDGFIDILGGKQTGEKTISVNTDNNWVGNQLTQKTFQTTGARVQLGISGNPYFRIVSDAAHNKVTLMEISNNAYFLQTNNFNKNNETGMKIDLANGDIIAYQFYLEAGSGNNKIFIDSEATTYPLKIGSNFKVSWGGVLECQGAEIDEADITNADIDVATIDDATISNAVINDAEVHRGTIEDASISRGTIEDASISKGTITSATIDKATINDADINDAKMNRGTITNATIDTANINDATMNRGTITSATINEASINDAKIHVATLTGEITGANDQWSIDSDGIATFGKWKFNGNQIKHTSGDGYFQLVGGNLSVSGGLVTIAGTDGTWGVYIQGGTWNQGDLHVTGEISNEWLSNKLSTLETKINEVVEENKSLKIQLDTYKKLYSSAQATIKDLEEQIANHECDTGGDTTDPGENGGAGSE